MHVPRDSPKKDPENFLQKGLSQGHMTRKFWGINANCFTVVKDTDFKFDKHVSRNSPKMTP